MGGGVSTWAFADTPSGVSNAKVVMEVSVRRVRLRGFIKKNVSSY